MSISVMVYLRKLLMSNIFFRKYFIINYVLNFMYITFNEKSFNEKFFLQEKYIIIIIKQK